MERRGNRFVRYADDCVILFKSKRSAMRVKETVTRYLEEKLFVKVNQEKTKVAYITDIKFLGFGFYIEKSGNVRITVHKKSKEKMKRRIKEITKWLNEKIHWYGSTRTPKEVIANVCGKEVSAEPLVRYFEKKYASVYDLK